MLLLGIATLLAFKTVASELPASKAGEVAESKEQRDARMAWWREAQFGRFIHWGGEPCWNDAQSGAIAARGRLVEAEWRSCYNIGCAAVFIGHKKCSQHGFADQADKANYEGMQENQQTVDGKSTLHLNLIPVGGYASVLQR